MTPAELIDLVWKFGSVVAGGSFLWFKVGALTKEVAKMPTAMDNMRADFTASMREMRVEFARTTERLTDTVNDHSVEIAALRERTRSAQ